jgi:hypothetical protein
MKIKFYLIKKTNMIIERIYKLTMSTEQAFL